MADQLLSQLQQSLPQAELLLPGPALLPLPAPSNTPATPLRPPPGRRGV